MGLVFAITFPTLVGFFIASWFLRGDTEACFFDRIFFGFGIGTGLLSLIMFFFGLMGIGFSLPVICLSLAIISVVFIIINVRAEGMGFADYFTGGSGTLFSAHSGLKLAIALVLLIWLLLKFYFVISESMLRPVFSWDTWFNWSAGAKFFFYEKGFFMLDPDSEFYFGSVYRQFLGHPLHTPLLQVWFALCVGGFDEALVTMWSPLYFIALVGVFHLALKKEVSPLYGLICAFFLASAPLITYHAIDAYSDLPLAFYFLASSVSFWRYLKLGERRYLMLSGLFLGISVFTKNEGLFFFIATGASLFIYLLKEKKPLFSEIFAFMLPFLIFAAPWLIFKTVIGIGFGHSGADSGLEWLSDPKYAEGGGRGLHFEVIWIAIKEVFLMRSNFNLLFPFWIILSVWGRRRILEGGLKYLYIIIFLTIGAFVFTYLTLEATAVTEATGIHRNLLTYTPVIFFSAAILLVKLIGGGERE